MLPSKTIKKSNSKSIRNNVDKELAALDRYADAIKKTEESDFGELKSMLKSISRDIRDINHSLNDIRNDIRALDGQVRSLKLELNSMEDRMTSVEGNVTEIQDNFATVTSLCSKLAAMNENLIEKMQKQENFTKSKQALLHSEVDSDSSYFINRIRALFANVGVNTFFIRLIDVQRFNKLKHIVLLSFPSVGFKSEFYFLLKKYRERNTDTKMYMKEFLAQFKYELLKKCLILKESGKIHAAFAFANNVFVKKSSNDNPKLIRGDDDLTEFENQTEDTTTSASSPDYTLTDYEDFEDIQLEIY